MKSPLMKTVSLVAALAPSIAAVAADYTWKEWIGDDGGSWTTPANWSSEESYPSSSSDTANFTSNGSNIKIDGDGSKVTVGALNITQYVVLKSGEIIVDKGSDAWTNLAIGDGGTLVVEGGTINVWRGNYDNRIDVGYNATSNKGTLSISGGSVNCDYLRLSHDSTLTGEDNANTVEIAGGSLTAYTRIEMENYSKIDLQSGTLSAKAITGSSNSKIYLNGGTFKATDDAVLINAGIGGIWVYNNVTLDLDGHTVTIPKALWGNGTLTVKNGVLYCKSDNTCTVTAGDSGTVETTFTSFPTTSSPVTIKASSKEAAEAAVEIALTNDQSTDGVSTDCFTKYATAVDGEEENTWSVAVILAEDYVRPTINADAAAPFGIASDKATLAVSNVKKGLYYYTLRSSSATGTFTYTANDENKKATSDNEEISLSAELVGDSAAEFFRLGVSYEAPAASGS